MKRTVLAAIFLLSLGTTPLYALRITSVDDVIRMHRAGVSDELIEALLERPNEQFVVTSEDVIAMNDAGLSPNLIDAVVAAAKPETEVPSSDRAMPPEPTPTEAEDSAEPSSDGEWCLTFDPPVVLLFPDYYFLPPWLWDPHWYMPRLDSQVGARDESKRSGSRTSERGERSPRESPKAESSARTPRSLDWTENLVRAARAPHR